MERASALGVAALLVGLGAPAGATPDMLQRAAGNVVFAPLDLALSPLVAGRALAWNLRRSDDPTAVKVAFAAPGLVWNTGVLALASALREISGLLELLPGAALSCSERDPPPLFDAVERSEALVDVDTPVVPIKFGIDYTSG